MIILSADDITQAKHHTKQTLLKRWLILMLYKNNTYTKFLSTLLWIQQGNMFVTLTLVK